MKLIVVSVYDIVSQVFSPPMLSRTEGEAKRQFEDAICNPNSVVGQHPEDLKLMKLGVFDDTDGMFEQGSVPVLLMSGYKAGDKDVLQLLKSSTETSVHE